jgi:hypothetical protein
VASTDLRKGVAGGFSLIVIAGQLQEHRIGYRKVRSQIVA